MPHIDHPAWRRLVELHAQIAELTPRIHEIPAQRWNALADEQVAAARDVRSDGNLMRELRGLVATSAPDEAAVLHEVLTGAVWEHRADLGALRADPRVADVSGDLDIRPALYLAEVGSEDDPYAAEELDDDWRDLSRIGGVPTATPGSSMPDGTVFLLQLDGAALTRLAEDDETIAAMLRAHAWPADGLVQVFHTTLGDSRTAPDVPNGGAVVRHVAEDDVRARGPIESGQTSAHAVEIIALPTFQPSPDASADAVERAGWLQLEADQVARNGSYPDGFEAAAERSPFEARAGAVVHLGGLAAPDFGMSLDDVHVLSVQLPLQHPSDEHVLLFDIPGDPSFGGVFGDSGHLEIWIRRSDLDAHRFSPLATFIRSA
ncbi:DUF1963 domain-containing protein [Microbacterium sp. NPDC055910]|uniref:DUF1963 domain-containing protein n=1 Tax=Microbacterium sp. NPDC055910 TaxID=3345659 RepID=UPI0035E33BFD